jgi:DNA-binding LytR/AlgR family response regulator
MKAQPRTWYAIGTNKGKRLVKIANIIMLVGNGACVTFYILDESEKEGYYCVSVGKHLKCFENAIHPDLVRINRSHIVNLNYVLLLIKKIVLMRVPKDYKAAITRVYLKAVQAILGLSAAD